MRLLSQRPGALASVDLAAPAWRLLIIAGDVGGKGALQLVYRMPPAVPFTVSATAVLGFAEYHQLIVASTHIEIAQGVEDLKRVAAVALDGGTRADDVRRVSEAMALFRNLPRLREETYKACLADAVTLVEGYWNLVEWVLSDDRARVTWKLGDAQLVAVP